MKSVLTFVLCALLVACSAPAPVENTSISPMEQAYINQSRNALFHQNVAIGTITGGQKVAGNWPSVIGDSGFRDALARSLEGVDYLASDATSAKYAVDAEILGVDQPMAEEQKRIVSSVTVTTRVRYTLSDKQSGKVLFDKTVAEPSTSKFADSFFDARRQRLAYEGSVRDNISAFLNEISTL